MFGIRSSGKMITDAPITGVKVAMLYTLVGGY
jgi:hypothetical protein